MGRENRHPFWNAPEYPRPMAELTVHDHRRDSAGLTYVYPVWSRRSGGLSIGINLNTNNACNWACGYCQVPGLSRGSPPEAQIPLLAQELRSLLTSHQSGEFDRQFEVPQGPSRICDIAISGNGEPTSCPNFSKVTEVIGEIASEFGLLGKIKLVIITNGSLMDRPDVRQGLAHWGQLGGEAWFKLDRGSATGIAQINHARTSLDRVRHHLEICLGLLPTWIQTCLVTLDGEAIPEEDIEGYLKLMAETVQRGIPPEGVLLYGLARPPLQADAPRLGPVPEIQRQRLITGLEALGLEVRVSL